MHGRDLSTFSITTHKSVPEIEDDPGELISIQEHAWLYIPSKQYIQQNDAVTLAFHFHTDVKYSIHEHIQRQAEHPLLIFNSGSGSSAYKIPFENTELFSQLQKRVLLKCTEMGASENAEISDIEISSFSAGYGAVREILKSSEYVQQIKTVIVVDSMYAGYADQKMGLPVQEHIQAFVDFAKLAMTGEKTFLITFSKVFPESYASTEECAVAIVDQMGGKMIAIKQNENNEHGNVSYPMIARYDFKGFHVCGFSGDDANAHVAHVHSLAELWKKVED